MLFKGTEKLINNIDVFAIHVDQLSLHAWMLTEQQSQFLNRLVRLRAELRATALIILSVEGALYGTQQAASALMEERSVVREAIVVHELRLAAFLHHDLNVMQSELKSYIQQNIVELLIKRRVNMILTIKMKDLGTEMLDLMDKMEAVRDFRKNIDKWWSDAMEAAIAL